MQVILPAPYWVSYSSIALLAQAVPVEVRTSAADGYILEADMLAAAITPRTKLLILCNP
jgi:aspartate/methionine/tyrosine aminotransferase